MNKQTGTLLIIHPLEPIQRFLDYWFEDIYGEGYTLKADDGYQAISYFSENKEIIDAIITKTSLPLMDADELITTIRKYYSPYNTVPILGIADKEGDARKVVEAGADVSYVKPINIMEFKTTLIGLVDQYHAAQNQYRGTLH